MDRVRVRARTCLSAYSAMGGKYVFASCDRRSLIFVTQGSEYTACIHRGAGGDGVSVQYIVCTWMKKEAS